MADPTPLVLRDLRQEIDLLLGREQPSPGEIVVRRSPALEHLEYLQHELENAAEGFAQALVQLARMGDPTAIAAMQSLGVDPPARTGPALVATSGEKDAVH